jgi:hypothetical protein
VLSSARPDDVRSQDGPCPTATPAARNVVPRCQYRAVDEDEPRRPLRDLAHLHAVLAPVLDRLAEGGPGPEYRLVGTAAALARGVPLVTGDVDLLVSQRSSVDRFATALSAFPCRTPPTWLAESRQYFARFDVHGTDVEISTVEWPAAGDTQECAGSGPWQHYSLVEVGEHLVPAVGLELRLVSELVRGRPDRYEPLIRHLRRHSADLGFVHKAMLERGVDPKLRQRVADELQMP